jgi:hypothetical protein
MEERGAIKYDPLISVVSVSKTQTRKVKYQKNAREKESGKKNKCLILK